MRFVPGLFKDLNINSSEKVKQETHELFVLSQGTIHMSCGVCDYHQFLLLVFCSKNSVACCWFDNEKPSHCFSL